MNLITFLILVYRTITCQIQDTLFKKAKAPQADVTGQTILITGGTAGLGKETARQIALMKPGKIIITARDPSRGQNTLKELKQKTGFNNIEVLALDLTSFKSVEAAAEELKKEKKLDVVVLNAGVGHYNGGKTEDGHDIMFQSNHLGHHLLTARIVPLMEAASTPARPARLVVLSSLASHFTSEYFLAKIENGTSEWVQYSNTKLINHLFVKYMAGRLGPKIVVNAIHPGTVDSEFFDRFPLYRTLRPLFAPLRLFFFKNVESGAATTVFVATNPAATKVTGQFWANMAVREGTPVATDSLAYKYIKRSEQILNL